MSLQNKSYLFSSYLFWADGGNSNTGAVAKIERSDLAGGNRYVLMTSSTKQLTRPTTIVIDFNDLRVYWLDAVAGQVGSCNMDGSAVNIWSESEFTTMSTMALYKVRHQLVLLELTIV